MMVQQAGMICESKLNGFAQHARRRQHQKLAPHLELCASTAHTLSKGCHEDDIAGLPQTTAGLLREYDVQRLASLGSV